MAKEDAMLKHGQTGNYVRHVTTAYQTWEVAGKPKELPVGSCEVRGAQRWCGVCKTWKEPKGVVSMILGVVGCPTCQTVWSAEIPDGPDPEEATS